MTCESTAGKAGEGENQHTRKEANGRASAEGSGGKYWDKMT